MAPRFPLPALPSRPIALFLDFDGTLVDFAVHPAAIAPDPQLTRLLGRLLEATCGALALVSGRTLDNLDHLVAPLRLAAAGIHGAERRSANGATDCSATEPASLDDLRAALARFVAAHPGLLLEDKGVALAMHFRAVPWLEPAVRGEVQRLLPLFDQRFACIEGARVIEIRPAGYNKRRAVEAFLREAPFRGRLPVYLGDDLTDLDGFTAVRSAGGMAIAVGTRIYAPARLPHPAAVRAWLDHWARQLLGSE